MKNVYIRRNPSRSESVSAAVLAAGLGAAVASVAFYFTRAFLARDVVASRPAETSSGSEGEG